MSTHRGYAFCQEVAELSGIVCPSENELKKLKDRVKWLMSYDKRIVIHFTPYHGSWLNLVEYWFGIMNKKVLTESYGSVEELKKSFESFLETWNTLHAHSFDWTYEGKGLHQKAVSRFKQILQQSANKLEISSLTKQLQLMLNLFNQYNSEVSTGSWEELFNTIKHQEITLRKIITDEEGPKKKKNAENTLNLILATIEEYFWQDCQEAA